MSEAALLLTMPTMEHVLHALRDVPLVPMLILAVLVQLECTSKELFAKLHATTDTSTSPEFARDALQDAQHALHMINAHHAQMDSSWLELNANQDASAENTLTMELVLPATQLALLALTLPLV